MPPAVVASATSGNDGKPGKCMTHELWATLNRKMVDYLDSVSLQDLVDQQRAPIAGSQ